MSSVERWRVWVQRCADVRALASTLGDGGRPADAQLRVLRDKLPSLLDTLVEEVRSFEHRIDLLQKMLDEQIVRRDDLLRTVPVACVLTDAPRRHGVTRMIHGHTHRPARHKHAVDGTMRERVVLADWHDRGHYLEIDDAGMREREIAG